MNDKRKEQMRSSQKRLREIMKGQGKVSISDYVLRETRDVLRKIQKEKGYSRVGDAIDFLVSDADKIKG